MHSSATGVQTSVWRSMAQRRRPRFLPALDLAGEGHVRGAGEKIFSWKSAYFAIIVAVFSH